MTIKEAYRILPPTKYYEGKAYNLSISEQPDKCIIGYSAPLIKNHRLILEITVADTLDKAMGYYE